MTTTIHHPSPSRHSRWDAFKQSFTQSNYITDFWNWLLTLMSKAAELVLFGSVLYSGYQLLPGITHAPAQVDALVFVIQQVALDIGGMGLLKLARRAGLPKESFPVRVGITLVVLSSLKQAVPAIPAAVFVWVETVLLIARAIMAVLFGHAIHALREEYSESTITVKEARELREEVEGLASDLAQARLHVQQQLAQEVQSQVQHLLEQLPALIQEQVQQAERELHRHRQMKGAVHRAVEETILHPGTAPLLGATANAKRLHPRDEQSKGVRVQQFVREQQAQGHLPTLDEIMQACRCSKHTAIQHRRAVLEQSQPAGVQPKLTFIRAAGDGPARSV